MLKLIIHKVNLFSKKMKRVFNKLSTLNNTLIILLFVFSCCFFIWKTTPGSITLKDILKAGEITVITHNNAHSYYLYRDRAMGFEYDLAKAFADHLGVGLKIKTTEKQEENLSTLMKTTGAAIITSITAMPEMEKHVAFSDGYMAVQQRIIVNRNNPNMKRVEDLAGKTIHIGRGTFYYKQLEALKNQGINLKIKLHDNLSAEELIRQVGEGSIEATIADSHIALLNQRYYLQTVLADPIGEQEYMCWVVNRDAHKLLESINSFFKTIIKNGKFAQIYNKYYIDIGTFDYVDLREYHRRLKTRLPKYGFIIKKAANEHNFDWRLIVAQAYQESHLNPKARSSSGAIGLMQLSPSTARSLGVSNIFDPVQNINAGVRHLKNLYDYFKNVTGSDRLLITLAAYNIGQGHMLDARNLARKMNLDPDKWSSLSKTLPLLSYQEYHKDAIYGYCRGAEPVKYIKQIMIYYDILKRQEISAHSKMQKKATNVRLDTL